MPTINFLQHTAIHYIEKNFLLPCLFLSLTITLCRKPNHSRKELDDRKPNDETALVPQSTEEGYKFDFNDTSVIAYESNTKERKSGEACKVIKQVIA